MCVYNTLFWSILRADFREGPGGYGWGGGGGKWLVPCRAARGGGGPRGCATEAVVHEVPVKREPAGQFLHRGGCFVSCTPRNLSDPLYIHYPESLTLKDFSQVFLTRVSRTNGQTNGTRAAVWCYSPWCRP